MAQVTFTPEEIAAFPQGPPGPSGSGYSLDADGSVVGDGVTDDAPAINAFVDSVPDGSVITYAKKYRCNSTINLNGRRGLRFAGQGGYVYSLSSSGAQFITGAPDMLLFSIDNSAGLVHEGPQFWNTGFFGAHGGETLFKIGNTNRWGFGDCVMRGHSTPRSKCAVWIFNAAADSAYWWFHDTSILAFGPTGSYTAGHGGLVQTAQAAQRGSIRGGAWQGNWPSLDIQAGWGPTVVDTKFDGGNPAVRDRGVMSRFTDVHFECGTVSPCSGYQAVLGASTPLLNGCTFSKGGANAGSSGWKIDAGVWGSQIIAPTYINLETNFVDNGSDTLMLRGVSAKTLAYLSLGGVGHYRGAGSPEGAVAAKVGSLYQRTDGGAGTTLYVKEAGSGATGWAGK